MSKTKVEMPTTEQVAAAVEATKDHALILLSIRERDMVLAGLRAMQAGKQPRLIRDIAADSGSCLTTEEIDRLCERLCPITT